MINRWMVEAPVAHQKSTTQHTGAEMFKIPLHSVKCSDVLMKSLRHRWRIWILQGKAAIHTSRARQGTLGEEHKDEETIILFCFSPLLFSSRLCSNIVHSSLGHFHLKRNLSPTQECSFKVHTRRATKYGHV